MIDLRTALKVELHVHLEGSMPPATLLNLAKRNGIALPFDNVRWRCPWITVATVSWYPAGTA